MMSLINHNLVVAVVVWMRCPGSNTDLRLQPVIVDGLKLHWKSMKASSKRQKQKNNSNN